MCGFLGKVSYSNLNIDKLEKANENLVCRGPDSKKALHQSSNDINFFLCFNRLKIIDLSEKADQPMLSSEYNTLIMFNGEIYNHVELRKEMISKGVKFFTNHSDTEVVLNGLSYYGIEFVKRLRGQFSIVFFNKKNNKIYLLNDRLGQKPLYYKKENDSLIFSSNLISLAKSLSSYVISEENIHEYFLYGIVSSPKTIFEDIYKVQPAECIEIEFKNGEVEINNYKYWNPENYLNDESFDDDEFFEILNESIKLRSRADVPIANFLSGGIDSTAIIKNLHDQNQDINSFSVVVDDEKYNEERWSSEVSEKYKTNHRKVKVNSRLNINDIDLALNSLDEPYSDPSVIPSFILSKEISKYYKVAISGDGGDELLGGYKRTHIALERSSNLFNFLSKFYKYYPAFLGTGNFFLSKSKDLNQAYASFFEDRKLLKLLKIPSNQDSSKIKIDQSLDPYKSLLLQDYKYYLPEMMMFKVDRTSMANSLEVRSPFVDHKLVEYILSRKLHIDGNNINKKILKDYISKDFSSEFVNREKKGFVFDLENWVYSNIGYINLLVSSGKFSNNLDLGAINKLTINKSRINSHRIWKMFVLEHYLSRI